MHTPETTPIPPHVAVHVGEKTKMTPEVRKVWQQAEAAAIEKRLVQKERKERREVLAALTEKRDLAGILEAWNRVNALGLLPNLTLRDAHLLDMHVALQNDTVMDTLRGKRNDVKSLQDYIAWSVYADEHSEKATPEYAINESPFQSFLDMSTHGEMGEIGASDRTEEEHKAARSGIDVAVHTTDIVEFLDVLDTRLTKVCEKLTSYEKALLYAHLHRLLSAQHWPQLTTQMLAKNFAFWERVIGHQQSVANMTLLPEPLNFQSKKRAKNLSVTKEEKVEPEYFTVKAEKPTWHLPRDTKKALNDLRTALLGK